MPKLQGLAGAISRPGDSARAARSAQPARRPQRSWPSSDVTKFGSLFAGLLEKPSEGRTESANEALQRPTSRTDLDRGREPATGGQRLTGSVDDPSGNDVTSEHDVEVLCVEDSASDQTGSDSGLQADQLASDAGTPAATDAGSGADGDPAVAQQQERADTSLQDNAAKPVTASSQAGLVVQAGGDLGVAMNLSQESASSHLVVQAEHHGSSDPEQVVSAVQPLQSLETPLEPQSQYDAQTSDGSQMHSNQAVFGNKTVQPLGEGADHSGQRDNRTPRPDAGTRQQLASPANESARLRVTDYAANTAQDKNPSGKTEQQSLSDHQDEKSPAQIKVPQIVRGQIGIEMSLTKADLMAAEPQTNADNMHANAAIRPSLAKVGLETAPAVSVVGAAELTALGSNGTASENVERLATVVYAAVMRNNSVARMSLYPPDLGEVTALLRLRQDRMQLRLEVGSEAARELLSRGLERLREVLHQHGISLDRTTVQVTARNEGSTAQQESGFQSRDGGGRNQTADGRAGGQPHQEDQSSSASTEHVFGLTRKDAEVLDAAIHYAASLNVLA